MNEKIEKLSQNEDFFSFVKKTKIKLTTEINCYRNKHNNKCLNEFETVEKISRGLIWKVKKVLRYYKDEEGNIQSEPYALKRSHINTQKKHRFFIDDKLVNYFDKIIEEVKIMSILDSQQNIAKLYEVIYNPSHQFIYLITEYCDIGTIMNKHKETFEYYHNPNLIKYFISNFFLKEIDRDLEKILELEVNDENLVKRNFLHIDVKNKICKILFKQIFSGLIYIHQHNIAHLDIKPENIVFNSKDSQAKIIDFSISTILNRNENYTNSPGGSIHFQAPEIFNEYEGGSSKKGFYDPFKADIWSIGISMYLFLLEKFPFDSDSELELQILISNQEISYEGLPDDAQNFLKKILIKNPRDRLTNINLIFEDDYFNK
jgi:serine/threonine protein kinase